jgi:nucleotide-binding universal stress UspA family protein
MGIFWSQRKGIEMTASERPPRIVVGVSGSLANLAAVHAAVKQARRTGLRLLAIHAWMPVGGDITYHRAPCPQLYDVWRAQADRVLVDAFDAAFGGVPDDVDTELQALHGETAAVLTTAASRTDDLLVLGAGPLGMLRALLGPRVTRGCLVVARSQVLVVPPSELLGQLHRRRHPARHATTLADEAAHDLSR